MQKILIKRAVRKQETSKQPKQKGKRKPKPIPKEPTRTSIRERRPPIKYEDYEMNMMLTEMHTTDYRLKALNVLVIFWSV
ncbi:hypothetical protein DPMN_054176 [Dreissena polymorpha]|uniref:Uncharacterized protein n=1 Tax=Dreissena polymorpha TaxID=45954 RepID=A0A9D4CQ21_DREPO|nr:hypothetical protein DPMN_054176 [Dreissena polymorpha]